MLLSLIESQEYIIKILKEFKNFCSLRNFNIDILNSYNHPYMPNIILETNSKNLVVVNFINFSNLGERELRSGHFYDNVNEFTSDFNLFFMCYEDIQKTSHKNSLFMYELFNDFLYEKRKFEFEKDMNKKCEINIKIFIHSLSNLAVNGSLKVKSNLGETAFSCFSMFRANMQIKENLKEV